MTITTPQLVVAGCVAVTAIGVGSYTFYFCVRQAIAIWRAMVAQAEANARKGLTPGPQMMRVLLLATVTGVGGISLVFWGYIIKLFLGRL
jgi:hypothetical protein